VHMQVDSPRVRIPREEFELVVVDDMGQFHRRKEADAKAR
jgi:hypothetical protein